MTKKSTLLKVVSIIMIVIAAIAFIVVVGSLATLFSLLGGASVDLIMTYAGYSPAAFYIATIFSIIACIIELLAGIMGLSAKKKNTVKTMGIITLVLEVISLILAGMISSLSPLNFVSLVLPILYYIGATQCVD